MHSKISALMMIAAMLLLCGAIQAAAPNNIAYQGRLTDDNGTPITNAVTVIFSIYTVPSGGSSIYSTTKAITPDDNGVFTTELLSVDPAILTGAKLFLGIKVGTDPEMTPRQVLSSAPYAISSGDAQPGVDWKDGGQGVSVSTVSTSSAMDTVTISAPSDGYAIVTACGSIYWSITSTGTGMLRLKVSDTPNDVSENPGLAFMRFEFPGTGTNPNYPYNVSYVFPVTEGDNTFYFNIWHQVVNGSVLMNDHVLIAQFVPNRY